MPVPDLTPVQSSNIDAVGHDGQDLYVKFKNGGTYKYPGVSPEEHTAFVNAASIGKHFHAHIKAKYTGERQESQ